MLCRKEIKMTNHKPKLQRFIQSASLFAYLLYWLFGFATLIFIGYVILGCLKSTVFVEKMPSEVDMKVKWMQVPKGKALIYIIRPSKFFGSGVGYKLTCDGKYIGATSSGRYIYALLEPGSHLIASHPSKDDIQKGEILIKVKPGEIYFIVAETKMSIVGSIVPLEFRMELVRITTSEGREALLKCSLSTECLATVPPIQFYGEHRGH